jgi:hypothetical protein
MKTTDLPLPLWVSTFPELLNASCQIICIRKQQHTNHMVDDIKRILQDKQLHLQLKSEQKEIIQNVLERKDSMAVLPKSF